MIAHYIREEYKPIIAVLEKMPDFEGRTAVKRSKDIFGMHQLAVVVVAIGCDTQLTPQRERICVREIIGSVAIEQFGQQAVRIECEHYMPLVGIVPFVEIIPAGTEQHHINQ